MRLIILFSLVLSMSVNAQETAWGTPAAFKPNPYSTTKLIGMNDQNIFVTNYIYGATKGVLFSFTRDLKLVKQDEIELGYMQKGPNLNVQKSLFLVDNKIVAFYVNRVGRSAFFYYDVFDATTFEMVSEANVIFEYVYPAMVYQDALGLEMYQYNNKLVADLILYDAVGKNPADKHRLVIIEKDLTFKSTPEFAHENSFQQGYRNTFGYLNAEGGAVFFAKNSIAKKFSFITIGSGGTTTKKEVAHGWNNVTTATVSAESKMYAAGIYATGENFSGVFFLDETMDEPVSFSLTDLGVSAALSEFVIKSNSDGIGIQLLKKDNDLFLITSYRIREKPSKMLVVKYNLESKQETAKLIDPPSADPILEGVGTIHNGEIIFPVASWNLKESTMSWDFLKINMNDVTTYTWSKVDMSPLSNDKYSLLNFVANSVPYGNPEEGRVTVITGDKSIRLVEFKY